MRCFATLTLVMGLALPALAAEPNEDPALPIEAVESDVVAAAPEELEPAQTVGPVPSALAEQDAAVAAVPMAEPPSVEIVPALPTDAAIAATEGAPQTLPPGRVAASGICLMIEEAAAEHGLPTEFFGRVIWQESGFNVHAVSPAGAQGLAQFMPATALDRGLADPFEPASALRHSAAFLRELRDRFGNLGLAAASYNAGPGRVRNWLEGEARLPLETRNYVLAITGRAAEDWAGDRDLAWSQRVGKGSDFREACERRSRVLTAARRRELLPDPRPRTVRAVEPAREDAETPWAVELASGYPRQAEAKRIVAEIRRRHDALLSRLDPVVIEAKLPERAAATRYRVRIGAETRRNADKLCRGLKAAGSPCVVMAVSDDATVSTASPADAGQKAKSPAIASRRERALEVGPKLAAVAPAPDPRGRAKGEASSKQERALEEGPKLSAAKSRSLAAAKLERPARKEAAVSAKAPAPKAAAADAKIKLVKVGLPEPAPKRLAQSARS